MMQKCYKYSNALEGYKDLFEKYIDPRYSSLCYEALLGFYKDPMNYSFDFKKINENYEETLFVEENEIKR